MKICPLDCIDKGVERNRNFNPKRLGTPTRCFLMTDTSTPFSNQRCEEYIMKKADWPPIGLAKIQKNATIPLGELLHFMRSPINAGLCKGLIRQAFDLRPQPEELRICNGMGAFCYMGEYFWVNCPTVLPMLQSIRAIFAFLPIAWKAKIAGLWRIQLIDYVELLIFAFRESENWRRRVSASGVMIFTLFIFITPDKK